MAKVFAIVVTWNGERYVPKFIQSLKGSTIPLQVLVVDNASSDGTLGALARFAPDATVFPLNRNLGFGKANNIGMKYAYDNGAQHIFLLNQDAHVAPDVIKGLLDLQKSNPEFGIVSPLHLDGPGERLDFLFCQHLAKSKNLHQLLSDSLLRGRLRPIYQVDFVNAAFWMLSRSCLETVGLFNPAFQHYGEDLEYAHRVSFHDLRIGIVPSLYGFHDRNQNLSDGVHRQTLQQYLMREKAMIRYRLSRKLPGIAFNFISALSIAALGRFPGNEPFLIRLGARLVLLFHVFSSLPSVVRMKKIAYTGGKCFFEETDNKRESFHLR